MITQRLLAAVATQFARPAVGFAAVVVSSWLILHPLLDQYYLHIFEADARSTVNFTLAFASGEAFLGRPTPGIYPPYFDAQYLFYSLTYLLAKIAIAFGVIDASQLPTTQSIAIFAIRLTNLAAYSLGTGLAFLIFLRLSKHLFLSWALTAFVLFSPQMLIIDFLRIDHIIMALFLANLLLTMMVGGSDKARKPILHVLFGAVAATLTLTKITSVLFLIFPITAYIKNVREQTIRRCGVLWFCTSFAVCGLFLIARFLPHELSQPGFTATLAFSKVADVGTWNSINPKTPLLFYNFDQFLGYGPIFLVIFCIALIWVIRHLPSEGSFEDIVLIGSLLLLSAFGVVSFKNPRGLYVLAPLYLALIARALPLLAIKIASATARPLAQATILNGFGALLILGLFWPVQDYLRLRYVANHRAESIYQTRIAPVQWLSSQVPAGARITVLRHSDWASPPLEGLGYSVDERFLAFPYLDAEKMGKYRPPSMESVRATTDAIVLNSFHFHFYMQTLSRYGLFDLRNEWEQFFSELRSKFVAKRFSSDHANYGVTWTEIILIR